jgi:hypothetical protein
MLRNWIRRRPTDAALRRRILRHFAEAETRPTPEDVGVTQAAFDELARKHALVLDDLGRIVIANPFSGVPTEFAVKAGGSSWFANCVWDGLGILAALGVDGRMWTTCSDCGESIEVEVVHGRVRGDAVAHFLVPAARWYDDLAYT